VSERDYEKDGDHVTPSRIELEVLHAGRLDGIERQLELARSEALQLGLSTAAIDKALTAIGSQVPKQALRQAASGRQARVAQ
jgi:hypothetical protein